jgi:hypothetical protein
MIHEILSSDVDLVKGMINSAHSDAEILAQLSSRGIDRSKAAVLLDDLRHGRKPSVGMPFVPVAEHPRTTRPPQRPSEQKPQKPDSPPVRSNRRTHRRQGTPWWFLLLVLIFIMAIWYAFFHEGSNSSRDLINSSKHEIPPPPGK